MSEPAEGLDPEIEAISIVFRSLRGLDSDSQARVLSYVGQKLGVSTISKLDAKHKPSDEGTGSQEGGQSAEKNGRHDEGDNADDSLDGVSPVAKKWMSRNGLTADQISKLFSLGIDDIDLVAKSVPGDNKKARARNVFLLKGVAAYLSSGAARFAHEKLKEACVHYDAWDTSNFAKQFADLSSEVSGSKDSDYTLTARGLTSATELIKEMV